jgi:hypothetical protein
MHVHQPGLVSLSIGVLSTLAGGRPHHGAIAADTRVVWIGGPPADDDARVLWEVLTAGGLTSYDAVVEAVSERLFRRDLERIGAAADVGFFRTFYCTYAREILRRLEGPHVRIGEAAP